MIYTGFDGLCHCLWPISCSMVYTVLYVDVLFCLYRAVWSINSVVYTVLYGLYHALWSIPYCMGYTMLFGPYRALWSIPCSMVYAMLCGLYQQPATRLFGLTRQFVVLFLSSGSVRFTNTQDFAYLYTLDLITPRFVVACLCVCVCVCVCVLCIES